MIYDQSVGKWVLELGKANDYDSSFYCYGCEELLVNCRCERCGACDDLHNTKDCSWVAGGGSGLYAIPASPVSECRQAQP